MKNKILFLLHLPPPVHGSSMVGQQIFDSDIITKKYDCDFINLSTSNKIDAIGSFNLEKIKIYLWIVLKLTKRMIFKKYDLVYMAPAVSKSGFYKDSIIVFIIKLFHKNIVLHLHNKGVSKRKKKRIINFLYTIFFKGTKVILLSKKLFKDIKDFVKIEDTYICPNGIKNTIKQLSLKEANRNNSLLFLSNLIESKGVFVLLEACKLLEEKGVSFTCNFVGGIGDVSEKDFKEKVEEFNLANRVFYLGRMYDEDKKNIFLDSSIFVFPTFYHNETFGLVNLEAMMYGLPIITTDEGGITDLVKNKYNGFIIEKESPVELAEKIEILIDNPSLAKNYGKNGRNFFLEKYTSDAFEARMIEIFTKLIN